jgi:hypothetical protein
LKIKNMKKSLLSNLLIVVCAFANAQSVGINTDGSAPQSSAILDVKSTNKGFLFPRMTYAQRTAISSPATGLMVYQTDKAIVGDFRTVEYKEGVYVYEGSTWVRMAHLTDVKLSQSWAVVGDNQYSSVDGNVGIGTSSPDDKLDVNGAMRLKGGSRVLKFETSQGGTGTGEFVPTKYAPGIHFIRSGGDVLGKMEYVDTVDFANFLRFHTGATPSNDLTITSGHEVGIGTNNPKAKLQVSGGAGEQLRIHAVSDPIIQFTEGLVGVQEKKGYVQVSGDNLRMGTNSGNSTGKFIVRNNSTDWFFIDAAGRVGINQSNPTSQLHVSGRTYINNGNNESLALDGTNPFIQFYQAGSAKSFIQQTGSTLFMGVNGGNLQLDATQIAIGANLNTATGYKLAVSGKVICEELKVKLASSGWPDYVFDKKYNLPTLQQLATFIEQNKHLPNIPSAAEIEKNGLEVGEMQRKMMEKLEELTLYILQLEKKNQELNIRVANLEKNQ